MSLINDALNRAQADKQRAGNAPWGRPLGSVSDGANQCSDRGASGQAGTTAAPLTPVVIPSHFGKINPGNRPPPLPAAGSSSPPTAGKSRYMWLLLLGMIAVAAALGLRFLDAGGAKPQSAIGQIPGRPCAQAPVRAEASGSIVIRPASTDGASAQTGAPTADPHSSARVAASGGGSQQGAQPAARPEVSSRRIIQDIPASPVGETMPDAAGSAVEAGESGDVVLVDLTPPGRGPNDAPPAIANPAPTAKPNAPSQLKLDGIVFGPEGGAAIISGRSLRVGQEISGVKVVKISRGEVLLDFQDQAITLRL